jgi:hypothetical protein
MPYTPITLDPSVPSDVRLFVEQRVEVWLRDVRTMLEYPKQPGDVGFNFTAAIALFAILGGMSRLTHSGIKPDAKSFKKIARRLHAMEKQAGHVKSGDTFAKHVYGLFRGNLVHSLGLETVWRKSTPKAKRAKGRPKPKPGRWSLALRTGDKVARFRDVFSDEQLMELEMAADWATRLRAPILKRDGRRYLLTIEPLYFATRQLVREVFEDPGPRAAIRRLIKPWVTAKRKSAAAAAKKLARGAREGAMLSTTDPVVNESSMNATATAMRGESLLPPIDKSFLTDAPAPSLPPKTKGTQ